MNVTYYLKNKGSDKPRSVFAAIVWSYNRLVLYTDIKLMPDAWEHEKQKAKREVLGSDQINYRLNKQRERIFLVFNTYLNSFEQEPDKATFKKLLNVEFKRS